MARVCDVCFGLTNKRKNLIMPFRQPGITGFKDDRRVREAMFMTPMKKNTKPAAEKKAVEVKAAEVKTAEVKAAPARKASAAKPAAEKKAPAKKAPAKKPAEVKATVHIQFGGDRDVIAKDILDKAVKAYKASHKGVEVKSVELYVVPEQSAAYYVVNGDESGDNRIDL